MSTRLDAEGGGTESGMDVDMDAGNSSESRVNLTVKWNEQEFPLSLPSQSTSVSNIKDLLCDLTEVLPKRQKLIGLKYKGRLAPDDMVLSSLSLKARKMHKVIMMGSTEERITKIIDEAGEETQVVDDFDDFYPTEDSVPEQAANQRKLEKRISEYSLDILTAPRPGKNLVVLDIDHTIFDMSTPAQSIEILKRPYLDEFLTMIYKDYDIGIWSQTSWTWVEMKLTEMGLIGPNHDPSKYQICFALDKRTMFSVTSRWSNGSKKSHAVKPLQFIWTKVPEQFTSENTVHIDDLARNFAMNPHNGIKCNAYKNALLKRMSDRELYFLGRYLKLIARHRRKTGLGLDTFDHSHWEDWLNKHYNELDDKTEE